MMGVNKARRKKFVNFIMLGRNMILHCEEWKRLGPAAKLIYIHLKAKHNGSNNGDICLHYSELQSERGLRSPSTVSTAFQELERKGWIRRAEYGGLYRRPNRYELTGRYDDYIVDRNLGEARKYKEPTYSGTQKEPPIGHDAMGLKICPPMPAAPVARRLPQIEQQIPDSVVDSEKGDR